MKEETIYEFEVNSMETVRFVKNNFAGRDFYHIRKFSKASPDSPYYPTKNGISLEKDQLEEFFKGVAEMISYTQKHEKLEDLKRKVEEIKVNYNAGNIRN